MKIFRDKTDYDGTVVALGNFDGLHIAHMRAEILITTWVLNMQKKTA